MKYNKPNTKPIPILITLAASAMSSLISILKGASFPQFVRGLLFTVVIFGILGCLVRFFLDLGFKTDEKEDEKQAQTEADLNESDDSGEEASLDESKEKEE